MRRRRLQRWAGALSLGAAATHGALTGEHLQEWWGYGIVFLAAAVAQAILGLALVTDALRFPDGTFRQGGARLERAMLWSGLVGTLLLFGLYAWTRTVGIPAGPNAGQVEAVAPIDLVAKACELGTAALLAVLLRGDRAHAAGPAPA